MARPFRFPSRRQRTAIMGRTGSGKTQFASWLLLESYSAKQPWVIIDYKYDDLLNSVDRITEIGLTDNPKHPGLYIIHPTPGQDDEVEAWLWKVWATENTGLYFDEGYMIPDREAFNAILTQGRSKNIPAIILSQRPSWISRFVFSEADYYTVFHLNDRKDRKRVGEFLPQGAVEARLPEYHSRWYDVGNDALFQLKPVPDREVIAQGLHDKLAPKRRMI
jgi:hypothetical protein